MISKTLPVRVRRERGFALVISLSLMVLLTVIAVGLLGLSSISLRSSTRGDAMAAARANARLALMFALGELQQMAGPDQRVTATADIAGTADGDPAAAGAEPLNNTTVTSAQKGLSAVQPGTRHWTGVWNQTAAVTQIFTRTPTPNLLGWLVSGNENTSEANRLTPASTAVAVGGGSAAPDRAVVLVGQNTVGAGRTDDYVSAPLVGIEAAAGGALSGRHAWWVGDEGVKAKLNLAPPAEAGGEMSYAGLAALRRGWEAVDGFGSYPAPGSAGEADLVKIVTSNEAALLDGSIDPPGDSPLKRNFHAATAESFGVLCDPLQGGLKLDLTAYLSGELPTSTIPGLINSPAPDANIVPATVANRLKGPKWSALKDFHDLAASVEDGALTVKPASADNRAAIGPVITDLRILFGVKLVRQGANAFRAQPCAKIAVSLANPYAFDLRWSSPLELEIKNATDPARRPSRIWNAAGQPAYIPQTPSEPAVLNRAVFTIAAATLPAGEARAYTMTGPALRPQNSTARITVPLGPFASSSPSNFANAVILDHGSVNTITSGTLDLDVREDATTTQINVELRSGSAASTLLRKIERFELDNAPFDVTQRKFTAAMANQFNQPVPLQLYNFQVSQPGADYGSLLPSQDQLGLRSSTLRTFADFNLQATRIRKPIISYNPPPYFMQIANSAATLPFVPPGRDTGSDFTRNLSISPMPWGRSPFDSRTTVLFSPPTELASLGQLQHADLTADDIYVSVGHQPGNAVGNSYATPFVQRARTFQNRSDFTITGFNTASSANTNYYDISYLLNAALWDTYFFSTVPRSGSSVPRNERMVVWNPNDNRHSLHDGSEAAARLLVNGAHNVNSVEKEAWKALLAGSKHLRHEADAGASGDAMFPRSLEQPSASATPPTGSTEDSFSGFRRLTDDQLDAVAEEITRQVRRRGPFVSMSHFVNRALAAINRDPELTRSGALQSALDIAGANISPDGGLIAFTDIDLAEDRVNLQNEGNAPRADLVGNDATTIPNSGADGIWPTRSHDLNPGAVAGILADKPMLTHPTFRREQGYRSTGIPGWVTQADLLQAIGPSLSVRSDTFRIRAYGESLDPATGNPVAKAWCEAVVQRLPGYVDGSNAATDRGNALSAINQAFGRRFHVVSFRWLSPHEI